MDMNELLRLHQVAMFKAQGSCRRADRQVHRILVAFYALRIRSLRASFGLPLAF